MPPNCRECLDVGEWTEWRGGARGIQIFCGYPAGAERRALLAGLS